MYNTPSYAFSFPQCSGIGRVFGDHGVLPHPLPVPRSYSIHSQMQQWHTLAYRPRRQLAEGRTPRQRGTQQRRQSVDGYDPPEDREGGGSLGQPRQQQQQREKFLPASATVPSSIIAGDIEDAVFLNDAFEELEGGRRVNPCVVHNNLAAGPTPYNDGWAWQKQVRGPEALAHYLLCTTPRPAAVDINARKRRGPA